MGKWSKYSKVNSVFAEYTSPLIRTQRGRSIRITIINLLATFTKGVFYLNIIEFESSLQRWLFVQEFIDIIQWLRRTLRDTDWFISIVIDRKTISGIDDAQHWLRFLGKKILGDNAREVPVVLWAEKKANIPNIRNEGTEKVLPCTQNFGRLPRWYERV